MDFEKKIISFIEAKSDCFFDINDKIWEYAETRFTEYQAAALQKEVLSTEGFQIKSGLAGEETAFIAEYGVGGPVIAMIGEYDALSGLSQKADVTFHDPIIPGGPGHGCGHQLLGTAALAAAVALKDFMKSEKVNIGRVRYYGCPAEENAGGKAFLVRDGFFDDVDIAISWHPHFVNSVTDGGFLANFRVFFKFTGTSAHAAGSPHLGRSALDAVELMNVGVNYMREHMISQARVHYAVTNAGGTAPNVVQSDAEVLYAIRAPKVTQVKDLMVRIEKIARGAALMTETEVSVRQVAAYSDFIVNETVSSLYEKYIRKVLPIDYTPEDLEYAQKFVATVPKMDMDNYRDMLAKDLGLKGDTLRDEAEKPISQVFIPRQKAGGSTDLSDVSWVCPSGQFNMVTYAAASPMHAWQAVAQGKSAIAHKGMLGAAKVMALTGAEFLLTPALIAKAKSDWMEALGGESYPNPLPASSKPEIW